MKPSKLSYGILSLALASCTAVPPASHLSQGYQLPDAKLTPGEVRADATVAEICTPGDSRRHRHTSMEIKHEVCAEYHVTGRCPDGKRYEIDHLIPLELGGADDTANLWVQPISQARRKDQLENLLHRSVCAGIITLSDAQTCIAQDWVSCLNNLR